MSDLDDLLDRDPTSLSSADIDAIITQHRNARARRASGEKLPRQTFSEDIESIAAKLLKAAPAGPIVKRRAL